MLRYLPFLLVLALWIYAFVDCLNTPEEEVRGLPKVVWVLIILLFGEVLVGPVAWLIAGRKRQGAGAGAGGTGGGLFAAREAPARWVAPDDNPEFLKSLHADAAPANEAPAGGATASGDATRLADWEADLKRREEELRRREGRGDGAGEG
ncbi:PLD nuclease N-terminal domain-containing protein [Streptomyces sp. NPDC090306]|uniref:PLD nuclease N-terminal domain-containing protein n=1 Tax=unclassified Streptomyces TaxID=2593676 RepID=UPI0036E175A8